MAIETAAAMTRESTPKAIATRVRRPKRISGLHAVPEAAHREQQLGVRRIIFNLVAQSIDEVVHDAAIAGVNATTFSAKDGVASLLARTMSGADKRALCAAAKVDV